MKLKHVHYNMQQNMPVSTRQRGKLKKDTSKASSLNELIDTDTSSDKSSDSEMSESDDDSFIDNTNEIVLNDKQYKSLLNDLYPSKYMMQKIKGSSGSGSSSPQKQNKMKSLIQSAAQSVIDKIKQKKRIIVDSSTESSSCEDDDEDSDEDDDDSEYYESSSSEYDSDESIESISDEIITDNHNLINMLQAREQTQSVKKCLDVCNDNAKKYDNMQKKVNKKKMRKNTREFKHNIKCGMISSSHSSYFKKLSLDKQQEILTELNMIVDSSIANKPMQISIIESAMPREYKSVALTKLNDLNNMSTDCNEFCKLKTWVNGFLKIPFGVYKSFPISYTGDNSVCCDFMTNAKNTLDKCTYGLEDIKTQILQMVAQLIVNPVAIGSSIAIHGPMGTGKTSLVKDGISKILNRPFVFISLGGMSDSSFLSGSEYAYEGSMYGQIVQAIITSKCMNPVIYFDELDKVSDTSRGNEIIGVLTHLIDSAQNGHFVDRYFSEISLDLSRCLFIFSYNDDALVNPILRDRMHKIQTKGYSKKDKVNIISRFIEPIVQEQTKFNSGDVIITESIINYIIDNLCEKEDGVRNLKRAIEFIYSKLNLNRLVDQNSEWVKECMPNNIEFPYTIDIKSLHKLLPRAEINHAYKSFYT